LREKRNSGRNNSNTTQKDLLIPPLNLKSETNQKPHSFAFQSIKSSLPHDFLEISSNLSLLIARKLHDFISLSKD